MTKLPRHCRQDGSHAHADDRRPARRRDRGRPARRFQITRKQPLLSPQAGGPTKVGPLRSNPRKEQQMKRILVSLALVALASLVAACAGSACYRAALKWRSVRRSLCRPWIARRRCRDRAGLQDPARDLDRHVKCRVRRPAATGPTPHNFNVRDASGTVLLSTKDLHAGDSTSVSGQLAPGTYTFFCAFPGHESLGMHGTLTVTAD